MSEQRTADNTPHVYKYGAPDTCKHCGNHRSHEVHTMTDQQTAATDNALVEKLLAKDPAVCDHPELLRNPDGAEAAERIKSLEAEVERLQRAIKRQASAVRALAANEETEVNILRKGRRDGWAAERTLDSEREANAILTAENERLEADRQRMRDALVKPLRWIEPHASHTYPNWTAMDSHVQFHARVDTSRPLMFGQFPLAINGNTVNEKFETIDAAKAYAQDDYAKRILQALNPASKEANDG